MNKKQLRELIEGAITYAEEMDAQDAARVRTVAYYQREWERLNYFMIALRVDLAADEPVLGRQVADFMDRVIHGKNPLIDDASPAQGDSK